MTEKRKLRPSTPGHLQKGYYGAAPIKAQEGTGGVKIVAKGMQRAIKVPCVECPFRRDSASGYLGGYTPEMYMEAAFSPVSLACHKSPGFHEREIERQRLCTGLAAFRANVGHYCHTHAQDSTDFVGEDRETYFGSANEFILHHKPGQEGK